MSETIEYPYSKNSAILGVVLPLIFFGITFNNLQYSYVNHFHPKSHTYQLRRPGIFFVILFHPL